jgi:hypothetical protein
MIVQAKTRCKPLDQSGEMPWGRTCRGHAKIDASILGMRVVKMIAMLLPSLDPML